MITTILTTGLMANDTPSNGASNPWENHIYNKQILYTETIEAGKTILESEWYFTDDNPEGIYIDNNGLIHGRILDFINQPKVEGRMPNEVMKVDGSNWQNLGGFNGTKYTFNFNVVRTIKYLRHLSPLVINTDYDPEDIITDITPYTDAGITVSLLENSIGEDEFVIEEETVSSPVSIMVIKNHTTENLAFVLAYFKAGFTLQYDSVAYDYNSSTQFLEKHPGPFGL